jgi:hypothetical protein
MLIRDNLLVSIIVLNKRDKNQVILKTKHFFYENNFLYRKIVRGKKVF